MVVLVSDPPAVRVGVSYVGVLLRLIATNAVAW